MDQALKSRILENKLVEQIRSWLMDCDAFAALCDDLKLLAREWCAVSLIDKELVAHLFLILTVTRNMAADWSAMVIPRRRPRFGSYGRSWITSCSRCSSLTKVADDATHTRWESHPLSYSAYATWAFWVGPFEVPA